MKANYLIWLFLAAINIGIYTMYANIKEDVLIPIGTKQFVKWLAYLLSIGLTLAIIGVWT